VDFGTLSGRSVIVNVESGEEVAYSVKNYKHGVMSDKMPDGKMLPPDWALQHPQDYLDVLQYTIPDVLKKSGVSPEQVIGVGIDFTACTLLPIKKDGTPLCFLDEYKNEPHAYVKLWKHHAAQDEADKLNEKASKMGEKWLPRYGGKISSEWAIPKIWQVLDDSPKIYDATEIFIEACDWIIFILTGKITRNTCSAGYKAIWNAHDGYPSKIFFKALDPRLENIVEEKLSGELMPNGSKAGEIDDRASKLTGLKMGTAIAIANLDAHVSCVGVGITSPGQMLMIMGTSTCHMLISESEKEVPGMCGAVKDGILPGYIGYEAGQSCVGDHFQWFVENCVPARYEKEAEAISMNLHQYLTKKAQALEPGESGLVALDWWNGNRSVLVDGKLSGMIVGCTLNTKPEEIYRALIEATAYGTRMIIKTFEENGVPVNEIFVAGGIADKNPFIMQVYSDVTRKKIRIAGSPQTPALSSAIFGAVAAGSKNGGYKTIKDATAVMSKVKGLEYKPNIENSEIYDLLFHDYEILHDYFGRGQNDVMKRLKNLKEKQAILVGEKNERNKTKSPGS
jgi:L-ribulokinase